MKCLILPIVQWNYRTLKGGSERNYWTTLFCNVSIWQNRCIMIISLSHIVLYPTILYLTVWYHNRLYRTVPYPIISYCTIQYFVVSYHTSPYLTVQYHLVSYSTLPYHTIPFCIVSYFIILYCTVLYTDGISILYTSSIQQTWQ